MISRNKGIFSQSFLVQNLGLIFAIVSVGLLYSYWIRPEAAQIEITGRLLAAQSGTTPYSAQRSVFILVKDYEQQICLTLMVWALIILTHKLMGVAQERKMLTQRFLQMEEGERIIPDDALDHYKELQVRLQGNKRWHERILPEAILSGLHRFHSTQSIQDVVQAIKERLEQAADQLDSDLSLIRYIAWAIPSFGFIGTVRGIGDALAQADKAIQGDLSGVTDSLGLAFNSTLVALVLSIILMFLMHVLQSRQDNFILEAEEYCQENLVGIMKIPASEEARITFS